MKKKLLTLSLTLIVLFNYIKLDAFSDSYVMTYCYNGTPYIYQASVEKTGDVLDTLSPSSFDANSDGTVTVKCLSKECVHYMQSRGISVTPFFSNHWDRDAGKAALNNIGKVTKTLAQAVAEYDLDGINIDIENVTEEYRAKYTKLLKKLRQKLPDSIITVAVPANPENKTTGWQGCYDYKALAKYCDYLMIMAYDESYYGSEPGPVASGDFVENSIKYALEQTKAEKIVLGVPLYGRYWKDGDSNGGYAITMLDVESIITQHPDASVVYHEKEQSAEVIVTLDSDFKMWGGRTLSPGKYTIWYDNLKALEYKISLINSYGLKGIGSWSIGQEADGFWDMCSKELENPYFTDIAGHWAEHYIDLCYEKGWIGGNNDNFNPEDSITRAEMNNSFAKFTGYGERVEDSVNEYITHEQMAVILDNTMELSNAVNFQEKPFSDINRESNPASYDSIIKTYANGIISGFITFRPNAHVTKAEFASILYKLYTLNIQPKKVST